MLGEDTVLLYIEHTYIPHSQVEYSIHLYKCIWVHMCVNIYQTFRDIIIIQGLIK